MAGVGAARVDVALAGLASLQQRDDFFFEGDWWILGVYLSCLGQHRIWIGEGAMAEEADAETIEGTADAPVETEPTDTSETADTVEAVEAVETEGVEA